MSPETAVAAEWRRVFTNAYVKLKLALIAVDEAHCITEWSASYMCIMYVHIMAISVRVGVRNSEKILSVLVRYEH